MSVLTPSQTVGPFYAYGLTPKGRAHWDPDGTYSWKETIGSNMMDPRRRERVLETSLRTSRAALRADSLAEAG